ncbi:hypothetical protein Tco_1099292, partial [Tanacetum coccineum]
MGCYVTRKRRRGDVSRTGNVSKTGNAWKRVRKVSGKQETFHVDWKHLALSRKRLRNVSGPLN